MNALLALSTLALTPGAHASRALSATPEATDEQCGVALSFIQTLVAEAHGRKVVFSDEPELVLDLPANVAWRGPAGRPVPGPAAELVAAARTRSAIAACGSIREWLTRKHIGFGERIVVSVTHNERRNGSYRAIILGMSLPAISADHAEAVVVTSSYAAGLAGGGEMRHLKRMPDGWKQVSTIGLYVS